MRGKSVSALSAPAAKKSKASKKPRRSLPLIDRLDPRLLFSIVELSEEFNASKEDTAAYNVNLSVPQFDDNGGVKVLRGVRINSEVDTSVTLSALVQNTDTEENDIDVVYNAQAPISLSVPGGSTISANAADGSEVIIDPGESKQLSLHNADTDSGSDVLTGAQGISNGYAGTGNVNFNTVFSPTTTLTALLGASNITGGWSVQGTSRVRLTYSYVEKSSVSGTAFTDNNGNGVPDSGEAVHSGETVTLAGTDIDGNSVSINTTTDASGIYTFSGIMPGNYTVANSLPGGFTHSSSGGVTRQFVADITSASATINFGYFDAPAFSGTVVRDEDGNGSKNGGESGAAGITVELKQGATVAQTTTTDSDGKFTFQFVAPSASNYTVHMVVPSGELATGHAPANDYTPSAFSGVDRNEFNFFLFKTISVSGTVKNDLTANGASADDTAQNGVTVNIFKESEFSAGFDADDALVTSTTTAGAGNFSFTNLGPGRYYVDQTPPTGFAHSSPGGAITINATSGADLNNANFLNRTTSVLKANSQGIFGTKSKVLSNVQLGVFTDTDKDPDKSHYSALISWGDGLFSNGTIVGAPTGWKILGTHTYSKTGLFKVNVLLKDLRDNSEVLTNDQAQIFLGAPLKASAISFSAKKNVLANPLVAAFTDGDPNASLLKSGYSAQVVWGDGTTTNGGIFVDAKNSKQLYVGGSHKYTTTGKFVVKVTIQNLIGAKIVVYATATVAA